MVAQLWLRSVTHSSRMLKSWRDIGTNPDKISVVINRSGAKYKEGVTQRDYERVCTTEIKFQLANETRAVVTAENQGKTVVEVGNSQLATQFRDLAGYLISLRDGKPFVPTADGAGKPSLTSIFQRRG